MMLTKSFPGAHVKGEFTLGENIGDLAGMLSAYDAYHASLGGKEAPVIDGTTGDQRFYLGWAQVWRRNYREANLRARLLTDPHAPIGAARVRSSAISIRGIQAFGVHARTRNSTSRRRSASASGRMPHSW